jgi:hypothetical protein
LDRGQIHFPPKREPLRDEVHALGALMGETLREQGGAELFTLVELDRVSPRSAAAAARRVPEEAWERRQRAVERDIVVIYGQPEELERAEPVPRRCVAVCKLRALRESSGPRIGRGLPRMGTATRP